MYFIGQKNRAKRKEAQLEKNIVANDQRHCGDRGVAGLRLSHI
jgi:hypothetical protein